MNAPARKSEAGLRDGVMAATGRTAAQAGWDECKLVAYMRKRGATSSDIAAALQTYRAATRHNHQ